MTATTKDNASPNVGQLTLHGAEAFGRLEHALRCMNGAQSAIETAVAALGRAHLDDFRKRVEKIGEFNRYVYAQLVALTARVGEG